MLETAPARSKQLRGVQCAVSYSSTSLPWRRRATAAANFAANCSVRPPSRSTKSAARSGRNLTRHQYRRRSNRGRCWNERHRHQLRRRKGRLSRAATAGAPLTRPASKRTSEFASRPRSRWHSGSRVQQAARGHNRPARSACALRRRASGGSSMRSLFRPCVRAATTARVRRAISAAARVVSARRRGGTSRPNPSSLPRCLSAIVSSRRRTRMAALLHSHHARRARAAVAYMWGHRHGHVRHY